MDIIRKNYKFLEKYTHTNVNGIMFLEGGSCSIGGIEYWIKTYIIRYMDVNIMPIDLKATPYGCYIVINDLNENGEFYKHTFDDINDEKNFNELINFAEKYSKNVLQIHDSIKKYKKILPHQFKRDFYVENYDTNITCGSNGKIMVIIRNNKDNTYTKKIYPNIKTYLKNEKINICCLCQ